MVHKHGGDIYTYQNVRDFSANINFRGMPEGVRTAAIQAIDQSVHYPDPECRTLKRALAEREKHMTGAELFPEQILCGNGAAELMFALTAACRPKQALLAVPSFYEYEQALEAFGCEISRFMLNPEDHFRLGTEFLGAAAGFAHDILQLERTASEGRTDGAARDLSDVRKRGVIILGNPNNPTGRLIEAEVLRELIALCQRHSILLVLDESFFDFLSEDDRPGTFSGASVIPEIPDVFVIRSFTKIYALPGIRFGYGICGDQKLLVRMRGLLQPWNVSLVAQEAASAAAAEYVFAKESARETARNRKTMEQALTEAGYAVFPSNTNFLLFRGPENLADFCLRRGFLIRDCSNFPGLERTGDGWAWFRICIRSGRENEDLLTVLRNALYEKQKLY